MPADRPFTDAELEAGATALFPKPDYAASATGVAQARDDARRVLDAVLPDHDARVRAEVAEEIAEDIADNPGPNPSPAIPAWWSGWMEGRDDAAAIARQHANPPATEGGPE